MRPLALVTGASSGIGAAFARALARKSYDLVLVARRRERLETLAAELPENDVKVEVLPADLADDADLARVEKRIAADDVTLLVNNAGIGTAGRFWEDDLDKLCRMYRVHVTATMRLTHAALRGMVKRDQGAIINVSSLSGFARIPDYKTSYAASKGWINVFTERLSLELRATGSHVKLQALCPGLTSSGFYDAVAEGHRPPSGKGWMQPEEVVFASLHGLELGDLFVVPGWRHRGLLALLALMPRRVREALILRPNSRYRKALSRPAHPPGHVPSIFQN